MISASSRIGIGPSTLNPDSLLPSFSQKILIQHIGPVLGARTPICSVPNYPFG